MARSQFRDTHFADVRIAVSLNNNCSIMAGVKCAQTCQRLIIDELVTIAIDEYLYVNMTWSQINYSLSVLNKRRQKGL